MIDYQRIVDDLRNAAGFIEGTPDAVLERIVTEYREACIKTNDRLRECDTLLKRGLRSEAIQLSEIEPNLLDVVVTLDFPERSEAVAVLRRTGISLPALDTGTAAELNEAYADQQPLDALLARHRHLALASAPLKDRLAVLRRIADSDPTNPIWLEDLGSYEQERFKEIRSDAELAIRNRDQTSAECLLDELKRSSWRQMPPDSLARSLEKALASLRKSLAREELETLERELNLAHGAMEVDRARKLRERWQAAQAYCPLGDDDLLAMRAAPALDWLAEEDRRASSEQAFADSLSRLERALDDAPQTKLQRDDLETLYHAALRHGFGLDPQLERQYRSRIDAWELSASRRTRLKLVFGTAAMLLISAGVVWGVQQQIRGKRLVVLRATLAQRLTAAQSDPNLLADAAAYATKFAADESEAAADPTTSRLIAEVVTEAKQENERAALFRTTFDQAKAKGPEAPDRPALTRSAELARTDAEKTEVSLFESSVSAVRREVQQRLDDDYVEAVDQLTEELAAVEKIGFGDLDRIDREIQRVQAGALSLQSRYPGVTQSLTFRLAPISTRLSALRTAADRRRAENLAMQAIVRAASDSSRLPAALAKFATDHPNNGRSVDFKLAAAEAEHWKLVEDWNRDVRKAFIETDLTKAASDLRAAAAAHARFPHSGDLARRADLLSSIAARKEANGLSKLEALRAIFDSPILQQAWIVRIKDDKSGAFLNYYLREKLVPGSGASQSVQYIADFSGAQKQMIVAPEKIGGVVEAPHCKMTAELAAVLDAMKREGKPDWEAGFAQLIRIVYTAEQVEPLLRLDLLQRFAKTGSQGSEALKQSLQLELSLLENPQADLYANWIDPRDEGAKQASPTARRDLARLTEFLQHAAAAIELAESLETQLSSEVQYEFFGCLLKDPEGAWRCETTAVDAARPAGTLLTLLPEAPNGPLLIPVGRVTDGVVTLTPADRSQLLDGRAVWLERVTQKTL